MPAQGEDPRRDEVLRDEAAAWLARLRGASTAQDHAAFEAWYDADPDHAAAYEAVLESWDVSGRAGATPVGQARPHLTPRPAH